MNDHKLCIGTSGWSYDEWKPIFYPEKLAKAKYLDYYAARFTTVEMNSIFYQIPNVKALALCARAVPDSFLFSVKANRYITHIKRLNDGRRTIPPFLARLEIIGEKMGPILLQIPPTLKFNRERLRSFMEAIPQDHRFVFEFHDSSWFNEITYDYLAGKNAALGIFQAGERVSPLISTADFVYIRMHKTKIKKGKKIPGLLDIWTDSFRDWLSSGKDVFCYFDQAGDDCAVTEALSFREGLEFAIGTGEEKGKYLEPDRVTQSHAVAAR